jgi:hypothetical protein
MVCLFWSNTPAPPHVVSRSIDQLDKADSPPIPETYIYLLGVQALIFICDGFATFTAPIYNSIVVQRPRAAGDNTIRAPPSLDFLALPPDAPTTAQLRVVRDIIDRCWPALLAALSFIINTNLSDDLFVDVSNSFQAMTNVSGMLGLTTPRDAFFTSLSKFAVPQRVVSGLDSFNELQSPRSATTITDNLGLTAPAQAPGLSERNLACLKILISCAIYLAGSLAESWYGVLETLQNADYVLSYKVSQQNAPPKRNPFSPGHVSRSASVSGSLAVALSQSGSGSGSSQPSNRHPLFSDLDAEPLLAAIQKVFDCTKNLEDAAFTHFLKSLCRLSWEMVAIQSDQQEYVIESDSKEDVPEAVLSVLSPSKADGTGRRRASGIYIPKHVSAVIFLPLIELTKICRGLETLVSPSLVVLLS